MGLLRSPKFQKVDFWKPREDNTKKCPLISPPSPLGDFCHQKRPGRVLFYAFNGTLRKVFSWHQCKQLQVDGHNFDIHLIICLSYYEFLSAVFYYCFFRTRWFRYKSHKKSHKPTLRPIRLDQSGVFASNKNSY